MYLIKRGYLFNKSDNTVSDIKPTDNFHQNEKGIFLPNQHDIFIPSEPNGLTEPSRIVAQHSYRKYPTKIFNEKLSKILREDRESTTKFQNKILTETGKIRTKIKEHIEDYDSKFVDKFLEKPIENQTEIPRLTNINEISKTLAILYSNVSDQNFIQNVSFYTSTKSSLKLGDSFTA